MALTLERPINQTTNPARTVARAYWLPLAATVLAFAARLSLGPLTIDDAYITFRYSRNIATGLGFVYNAGEHVLGTTTPLWTLVLAAFYAAGLHNLPAVAWLLSTACDSVTACLLCWLGKRAGWESRWTFLAASLFALNPFSLGIAASGMETAFFTLLLVGTGASEVAGRRWIGPVLAGLACVTRPEGVLLAVLLLAGRSRDWRSVLRAAAVVCTVTLPWLAFAAWYFGSPISESIWIKALQYPADPLANLSWMLTWLCIPGNNIAPLDVPSLAQSWEFAALLGLAFEPLVGAEIPRLIRAIRKCPERLAIVAIGPGLWTALALEGLKSSHIFLWYFGPLVPFLVLALVSVTRRVSNRFPTIATVLATFIVGWTLLGINFGRAAFDPFLGPFGLSLIREQSYAQTADMLRARLAPSDTVALPEIGAFGWETNARVLDTAGLVSPQVVPYYLVRSHQGKDLALPPAVMKETQPCAIVTMSRFLKPDLADDPWFAKNYDEIAMRPEPIWDGQIYYVFVRHGGCR